MPKKPNSYITFVEDGFGTNVTIILGNYGRFTKNGEKSGRKNPLERIKVKCQRICSAIDVIELTPTVMHSNE